MRLSEPKNPKKWRNLGPVAKVGLGIAKRNPHQFLGCFGKRNIAYLDFAAALLDALGSGFLVGVLVVGRLKPAQGFSSRKWLCGLPEALSLIGKRRKKDEC